MCLDELYHLTLRLNRVFGGQSLYPFALVLIEHVLCSELFWVKFHSLQLKCKYKWKSLDGEKCCISSWPKVRWINTISMANITHSKWTAWMGGMWSICFSLCEPELPILYLEITHTGIPPRLLIVSFFSFYFHVLFPCLSGCKWCILKNSCWPVTQRIFLRWQEMQLRYMVWKGTGWFCCIPQLVLCCRGELSVSCTVKFSVRLTQSAPPWWKKVIFFFFSLFEVNGMLYTSGTKEIGIAAAETISWEAVILKVQLVANDWIAPFGAALWLSEPSEWWLGNHCVYKQKTLNKGIRCPLQTALVICIWHKICGWFCYPHFKMVMKK